MPEEIDNLIARRGVLKGQLTRFWNSIKDFSSDGDTSQLKVKWLKVEECWEQFQSVQLEIENIRSPVDAEEAYRIEFEDLYFLAVAEYEKIMEPSQLFDEVTNDSQNRLIGIATERTNSGVSNQGSIVKLAALNVSSFRGHYKSWSTFHDMFVALIYGNEALSDVQRFFYLKAALTGDALKAIRCFEMSAKYYEIAWESLNERFNN